MDTDNLKKIGRYAKDRGLYLEYNFSLDDEFDPRLNNTFDAAITNAPALGSDIAKVSLDLRRPCPLCASGHHPKVMQQLEDIAERLHAAYQYRGRVGCRHKSAPRGPPP